MSLKINTHSLTWTQIYLLLCVRLISNIISINAIVYLCDVVVILLLLLQIKGGNLFKCGLTQIFVIEVIYWLASYVFGLSGSLVALISLLRVFVRFFIVFNACYIAFNESDYRRVFNIFNVIVVIHALMVFYQYFVLHYTNGDMVGGIFGVTFGYGNAASHALILLATLITAYEYFTYRESLIKVAVKFSLILSVAMLTEMKSFIFEAALIVIGFMILNGKLKARTGIVLIMIPLVGMIFMDYMENNFNFNIFDIESINTYLGNGYGYNREGISRTDGYIKVFERCFNSSWITAILGFGFATSVSPFTESYYGDMNLGNFTYAKIFYDVGIVGSILYFLPYILCVIQGWKLRTYNSNVGTFCFLLGILGIYLNFYGSFLESDFCGYFYYIFLALTFVLKRNISRGQTMLEDF